MKKIITFIALSVLLISQVKAQVYSGTIVATDPTFNRPLSGEPPTSLSGPAANVYYHVLSVPITLAGVYTFSALSIFDNWGVLYNSGGFDPLNPLNNAIESDDDGAGGFDFEIEENLGVGTYYLVVTTYTDGEEGDYTITTTGPSTVALPLKLLDFKATKNLNGTGRISWVTTQEENINYFEVERSADGKTYTSIGRLMPNANEGAQQNKYSVAETPLEDGRNIFRLKIVDYDGKINYSSNKIIIENKDGNVLLYPNPATQSLNLSILSGEEAPIFIKVYDLTGKIFIKDQIMGKKGKNTTRLDISNLPFGNYLLHYSIGDKQHAIKFQKN